MKRLLLALVAALSAISAFAYEPAVKEVRITVSLDTVGTAHIEEVWDVVVAKGTEWYLVREHLGDISIRNLAVRDENGVSFKNEGSWDVDRSISQKAYKCGLHRTGSGYEICWGVGSYGPHVFTVSYDMTNAVKTLNDSDMLHMQFVSPGLSSPPSHVRLDLHAPVALSQENSNIWGFGYHGRTGWSSDGGVYAESGESFVYDSSLILLVRFDKGIFHSGSVQDRDFQAVLDQAREGSHFDDDEDELTVGENLIATLATILVMWFALFRPIKRILFGALGVKNDPQRRKQIFGRKRLPKKPDWSRDIPFGGNILETYYIASHVKGGDDGKFTIVPAMMLRMVEHGVLELKLDSGGDKEFHFSEGADKDWMLPCESSLYDLLKEASGKDGILQEKEFSRWSRGHGSKVSSWVTEMRQAVTRAFERDDLLKQSRFSAHYFSNLKLNPDGQAKAMQALGFRQFLRDFTIINERAVPEVGLWGQYLIVAALFGIADQVASDMKRLAPDIQLGEMRMSPAYYSDLVLYSDMFGSSMRRAYSSYNAVSSGSFGSGSSGGFGGGSSFGGGGGFSGGGFGGGSR